MIVFGCALRAADTFVSFNPGNSAWHLNAQRQFSILADTVVEHRGVVIALHNLQSDLEKVTGDRPSFVSSNLLLSAKSSAATSAKSSQAPVRILVGSYDKSPLIRQLIKRKQLDGSQLKNKKEKFLITTLQSPLKGLEGEVLLIAGSDKRGTIYGIYELSRQLGVSPWYWWTDTPIERHPDLYVTPGTYTDGEPAVEYRGIFINDEWPCMGNWTTEKFGGFNSKMYVHIYELLLRLKANFLWPAMWSAAFYEDDPQNSPLADEMGIIIGTSHHEPMARNHQEYARRRKQIGPWNFQTNRANVEQFFREGIERMKGKEEVVIIAMRGDGDAPMGPDTDTRLLEDIVKRQREIIREVTGRPAKETPQLWALYSEVLEYYDKGMKIPDDVMVLLCDDNWGNVRRLPDLSEKPHPGGYGMYYHVDLHGAPRAYQWLNMTQIPHMWEQLRLTYDYGVRRMWILNVGDLKPNEYPTDFFLQMAWNPEAYTQDNLQDYARRFCAQQFGEAEADEAARILSLYCKYAARVSAEMLDDKTYNLQTGEMKAVTDEFLALEAYALRQFYALPEAYRDTYRQLILHPVQAMANLYELYYCVAMNRQLATAGDLRANTFADRAEALFARDAELTRTYHAMRGGKWNHIMDQTHIGYTSWNEPRGGNQMPKLMRLKADEARCGGTVYTEQGGVVVMEAERYFTAEKALVIPDLGRTLSGLRFSETGGEVTYKLQLKTAQSDAKLRLILDSTLPFIPGGHSLAISIDGGEEQVVNYNKDLNWANCYSRMYPAAAARVIEQPVVFKNIGLQAGNHTIRIRPLQPATVLHKVIVDCGGYVPTRLYMQESPYHN